MSKSRAVLLRNLLTLVVFLLITRSTFGVVSNYGQYFPPNFESDFLLGRQSYFWNGYHGAFYPHLISGPVSLILGMILISDRFRTRFPAWHRRLGRVQGICILFLVVPSGLWMATHAATGMIAGVGFGSLALATGICVACGWRSAVKRRFADHRRWMQRCFLLLCSAVVVRIIGGLATVCDFQEEWLYPLTAWCSWIIPLAALEFYRSWGHQFLHLWPSAVVASPPKTTS